jgi:3-hydroxyisobutyrate dehydrogenase-like beta-hydroxyacid dehydrogenase
MSNEIRLVGFRGPAQIGTTRLINMFKLNLVRAGFSAARMVRSMTPAKIQRVGFIGLGRMGSAIARNLLRSGFKLTVYNRTPSKMLPLVEAGAIKATSPADAVRNADVVITSLMDDQSVLDVVTRTDGLLATLQPNAIHIGTSTSSPRLAQQLAELHATHGSVYLAAPVIGRPAAADARQLTTFVAGDLAAIQRSRAVFDAYSLIVVNAGVDPASANILKLLVNYLHTSVVDLVGQAFTIGEKADIDPKIITLMLKTAFPNPNHAYYIDKIRSRDFDHVGFDLRGEYKDVQLMMQMSEDMKVALPNADSASQKLLTALANGMEGKDWSAIYEITRQNAGLR